MKRTYWFVLMLLTASALTAAAQSVMMRAPSNSTPISAEWFALHAIAQTDPWPTEEGIQFSSWRSVSTDIGWTNLEQTQGSYDWTYFDRWMARLQQYGQTMMYTVYLTPTWASSCPTCICNSGTAPPGSCYPPNDLNSDGSGSDQHLKDFVTALIKHVGPGKIQYLEVWNEPNVPSEWGGSMAQLVAMTRDVRTTALALDPNITITSPPETGDGKDGVKMTFLQSYLAAGGGNYVDIIGLHGYVYVPEDIITRLSATVADMQQYNLTSKPIFVTEGSWCCDNSPLPANEQPGFSFRLALNMLSTQASRFYLYAFESDAEGNLWNQLTQQITPNAIAYQLYYSWLVGATMTQPCQAQSSGSPIWSCNFTRSGGYQAEAIWNVNLPFGQTQYETVPSQYVQYKDLYGKVYQIQNNKVPVGFNPIWLEN